MREIDLGGGRRARVGYDFDDVALVPHRRTRDRELVDLSWQLDAYGFDLPLLSMPLDAVTSPATAATISELGGLAALNLEGLWTRHADAGAVLGELTHLESGRAATAQLRKAYEAPVREELIGQRIEELRRVGLAAGALTPQKVERYHAVALEAGLDLLVVNGVTATAQHVSADDSTPLDLRSFTARYDIPVVVGGVGSAKSALHLMRTGAVGVMVGIGVGFGSTTRNVLGVAVPSASAVAEVAGARDRYLVESGRYVQVIAAASVRTGGDIAKAIACGADAVGLGRPLAAATDAPAPGAYWGLAAAHHELPRGRYTNVEPVGTLREIVTGPADRDDGTMNLMGALRRSMAICGYEDLRAFQQAELVVRA